MQNRIKIIFKEVIKLSTYRGGNRIKKIPLKCFAQNLHILNGQKALDWSWRVESAVKSWNFSCRQPESCS